MFGLATKKVDNIFGNSDDEFSFEQIPFSGKRGERGIFHRKRDCTSRKVGDSFIRLSDYFIGSKNLPSVCMVRCALCRHCTVGTLLLNWANWKQKQSAEQKNCHFEAKRLWIESNFNELHCYNSINFLYTIDIITTAKTTLKPPSHLVHALHECILIVIRVDISWWVNGWCLVRTYNIDAWPTDRSIVIVNTYYYSHKRSNSKFDKFS